MAIRLSKAGYGTPEQILQLDSQTVILMLEYEQFSMEFDEEFVALNKETS